VGYGDFSPKSYIGKVAIMIIIIVAIALVPFVVNILLTAWHDYNGAPNIFIYLLYYLFIIIGLVIFLILSFLILFFHFCAQFDPPHTISGPPVLDDAEPQLCADVWRHLYVHLIPVRRLIDVWVMVDSPSRLPQPSSSTLRKNSTTRYHCLTTHTHTHTHKTARNEC
jgi:hypothetical protein